MPAYAILKANAGLNKKLRGDGKKALDFYGRIGQRRAQGNQRAAKKATKTPPTK